MTDSYCPPPGQLVEERVVTQYREAWNFLAWLRTALNEVERAILATYAIPSFFDLDTAVGEQLTFIGKVLGWPRCHCVCESAPVYGFACLESSSTIEIIVSCEEGTCIDCNDVGAGQVCIDDDDIYRRMLKARRYQFLGLYDIESPQSSAIFGGRRFDSRQWKW